LHPSDVGSLENPFGTKRIETAMRVRVEAPERILHGVNERAIHVGGIHTGDALRRRVGLLAMVGGRRTFLPEMDLCIANPHWAASSQDSTLIEPKSRGDRIYRQGSRLAKLSA
jgi:hypothetical protein